MKLLVAVGLLLAAGVVLGGCARTPAAAPAPSPSPAAPSTTTTPAATPSVPPLAGTAGSDGLTIRYQDDDGRTRTLRVEDFRR
jgi:multidrug efflux pump subunit AcrA (membrane-fusion protein)